MQNSRGDRPHMRQKLKNHLNKISLSTQLVALISIVFSFIIAILIIYNYTSSIKAIMTQQTETTTTMLRLETQNMDNYISEIDRYSLLLRQNSTFFNAINSNHELSYYEINAIADLLANSFDNRSDLISYRIYLLKNDLNFEITSQKHMVQRIYGTDPKQLPNYDTFTKGRYFKAIQPSMEKGTLCTYYRTIIRVEDKEPLAIVELTIDDSYISSIAKNYLQDDELLFMMDENDRILYCNDSDITKTNVFSDIASQIHALGDDKNYFTTDFQDKNYLVVSYFSNTQGFYLVNLKPLAKIENQIKSNRNVSLLLASLAISLSIVFAMIFIRLVTKPLSTLSHRLRHVGKGNFTTTTNISGSLEISNLAEDFNSMINHIDELIKKNYVSELNEKTARLIALEAQLNPHFLYNTLQAITSEAIVSGNQKIYAMINALASMLRYSIKDGDFVKLEQELSYVSDYLFLQNSRFDERLVYHFEIDPDSEKYIIPKISILTLVENSILHGMEGYITSIEITVSAKIEHEHLSISVLDNGSGITEERLAELKNSLREATLSGLAPPGIGLSNLYSRLQLLYNNKASLYIDSIPYKHTTITMLIPLDCVTQSNSFEKEKHHV